MPDPPLDVLDDLPRVDLVPAPIEVFGHAAELNYEVAGDILRLDLSALLLPQTDQGGFILTHDDPRIRAADEAASVWVNNSCWLSHGSIPDLSNLDVNV